MIFGSIKRYSYTPYIKAESHFEGIFFIEFQFLYIQVDNWNNKKNITITITQEIGNVSIFTDLSLQSSSDLDSYK